jgi:hypothetical protein
MMVTLVFAMSLYFEYVLDSRTRKILSLRLADAVPPPGTSVIPLKTLLSDIYPRPRHRGGSERHGHLGEPRFD